jgi:hypothetical protein
MDIITVAIMITKYAIILDDYCNSNKDELNIIFNDDENNLSFEDMNEFLNSVLSNVKKIKIDDVVPFVSLTENIICMHIHVERLKTSELKQIKHIVAISEIIHDMESVLGIN